MGASQIKQLQSTGFEEVKVRPRDFDDPAERGCVGGEDVEFFGQSAVFVEVVLDLFFEVGNLLGFLPDAFGTLLDAFCVLSWVRVGLAAEITLIGHELALLQIERVLEIWVIIGVAVDVYMVVLRVEKFKLRRVKPLPIEQHVSGLLFNFYVCDFDLMGIDFEMLGFLFIGLAAIFGICIDSKYPRRDMRSLPYVILIGIKQEAHRAGQGL